MGSSQFDNGEYPNACPTCGSADFESQYEWGDPGHEQLVPTQPINRTEVAMKDHRRNTYYVWDSVYDVSRLFAQRSYDGL